MKKRYFLSFSLVALVALTYSASNHQDERHTDPFGNFYDKNGDLIDSSHKSILNEGRPYLTIYDQNNHLIGTYNEEQMKELTFDKDVYKEPKEMDTERPYAYFYDENGKLLNASQDIKAAMTQLSNSGEHDLFIFRSSSFKNNIEIGQNRIFKQPKRLILEPNEPFEQLSILLSDSKGQQTMKMEMGNFIGGINIPLEEYVPDDSYTIQFINEDEDQSIHILGGAVLFN
ncbi:hypothetical protein [Domibacillus mangrovi]|uniref:Copper amine oxidase-like N-terminal domain-containing protein n=1 Tax=Domibacillus mangrovi TaxID=1714354 RepID=A0A1Q5NZA2_9BACI|nr:hypothetical protein [Domibacillus mangrovi]OKL35291.1 hypothetical protein BLL40_16210 [Domibacillus mangrovi]